MNNDYDIFLKMLLSFLVPDRRAASRGSGRRLDDVELRLLKATRKGETLVWESWELGSASHRRRAKL